MSDLAGAKMMQSKKVPTPKPLTSDAEVQPDRQRIDLKTMLKVIENELLEMEDELKRNRDKLKEKEDQVKLKDVELSQRDEEMKGICKRYDKHADDFKQEISKLEIHVGEKQAVISEQQDALGKMEEQLVAANNKITVLDNEVKAQYMQYIEARRALEKANRTVDHIKESHEDAMRHKDNQFKELLADRDDLRHRLPDRQHSDLEKKLELREIELYEHQTELKKKEEILKETEDKLKETENKLKETEDKLKETENKLKEKEEKLKEKEKNLNETEEKVRELFQTVEEYQVSQKKHEEEMNGVCKNYDKQADDYKQDISKLKITVGEQRAVISEQQDALGKMEEQLVAANNKITVLDNEVKAQHMQYIEARRALEKANRTVDHIKESHEDAMRHKDNQFKELLADRDDRFSRLAGAKLADQTLNIPELSDPNRAMKLSEKFDGLYDDQRTDAYEHLKKKKMSTKDAVAFLLEVLKKCEAYCYKLKETQMNRLRNVLLHPSGVASFGSTSQKHVEGLKEFDDHKPVTELRRQVGVRETVLEEVKQVFILETKSWPDKKNLEGCTPYVQRCAEICWLMVLHDPPLYMKMDVQRGDPFDTTLYSVYSASGDKIDFLVWPPLFNKKDGELLSKGTAEPMKVLKKP